MDNKALITVVSVHSPLIQFSPSGNYYTSYAISLKSNDPCFTHSYSQNRRRFSEFLHLRRLLESHYPTIKPPVLPAKNYFYRFSDSIIEQRKVGLQRFLEQVLSTSVYLSDKSLHLFLQSSCSMNQIDEECIGDIPAPQLLDMKSDESDSCSTRSSNGILMIEDNNSIVTESQRHLKSLTAPSFQSSSEPFVIPRQQGSLDSSPASSLSSLDTSYSSSLEFNRRRVSFNQNVTVAVVYNHLWNINTKPIRTDS